MEQSSLNVLDGCRNLRQSVINTRMDIAGHQLRNNDVFRECTQLRFVCIRWTTAKYIVVYLLQEITDTAARRDEID